jgi:hypothetical protein
MSGIFFPYNPSLPWTQEEHESRIEELRRKAAEHLSDPAASAAHRRAVVAIFAAAHTEHTEHLQRLEGIYSTAPNRPAIAAGSRNEGCQEPRRIEALDTDDTFPLATVDDLIVLGVI